MLNANALFPNSIRVLSVSYNDRSLDLEINDLDLLASKPEIKTVDDSEIDTDKIDQLRKQKLRYSWLDSPFTASTRKRNQLEIQTEYEKHTLLIRFPTKTSGLSDLLFIFFKNEEQLFRFSSKTARLSTELKQSIASVYVRSLDVIRKQIADDHKINISLNEHLEAIEINEAQVLSKKQLEQEKTRSFFLSLINKISLEKMRNSPYAVTWTKEAITKLSKQSESIEFLEKQVENALIIAINESSNSAKQIQIKEKHLSYHLDKSLGSYKNTQISDKYKKTYLLLDRYEKAAINVLNDQLTLTGANLGNYLSPSISAPAISDAIRKHGQKITYLLQEYPNRWEVLRKQFRPIQKKVHYTFNEDQLAS